MTEIKNDFQLLLQISSHIVNQISDSVIFELIELKDKHFLTSYDDSGLTSVWEEICVRVQVDDFYYKEAYDSTIENVIKGELEDQPDSIKILISYIGGIGDSVDYESEGAEYSYNEEYAIIEVMDAVISKAGAYKNENISRFLDQNFGIADDSEEGNDKDDVA